MSEPEASITVAVDPTNPGQFFACCGLLELADRFWPETGAEGWFAADGREFRIACDGHTLAELLADLVSSEVVPWQEIDEGKRFRLPNGVIVQALVAPIRLRMGHEQPSVLILDAWMTTRFEKGVAVAVGNQPWNFWSGQQKSLDIWSALRTKLVEQMAQIPSNTLDKLFTIRLFQKGRFGFDPGPAWNALDVGFSPNEQGIEVESSPAVEMLAAVGVQRFRPQMAADRESFEYVTWYIPLGPAAAAAMMSGVASVAQAQRYRGCVVSRGSYAALGFSSPILSGDSRE